MTIYTGKNKHKIKDIWQDRGLSNLIQKSKEEIIEYTFKKKYRDSFLHGWWEKGNIVPPPSPSHPT